MQRKANKRKKEKETRQNTQHKKNIIKKMGPKHDFGPLCKAIA